MKILSFLGPTNYKETKYKYGERIVPTRFFAEALPTFFPETEKILVFVTPTVEKHDNLKELKSCLGSLLEPVSIPESHTEESLWQIFDALIGHVEEAEEIVFDITNSFRSLPFLVFIAAAFLRSARNVKVKAVVYGAFEARDEITNISPVFNLTPFVSLFDWLVATNQFIYTGNAWYLASQLRKTGDKRIDPLAENVTLIARGLELLRPREVADAASELPNHLQAVSESLPAPFGIVVQSIEKTYGDFKITSEDSRAHLQSQLKMINWYVDKEHYVHALAMAREWLISLVCFYFEEDIWDQNARMDTEILLGGGKRGEQESRHRHEWQSVPEGERLRKLWSGGPLNLANLRNDVLHAGFRKNPKPSDEVISKTIEVRKEINEIARQWGIIG